MTGVRRAALGLAVPVSLAAAVVIAFLVAGCSDRDDGADKPETEARGDSGPSARRHVLAPPPGEMRAVPPHAIRPEGVGPYTLGASLEEILGLLPHDPRVELLQIRDLFDYSLVRIEDDALVIGATHFEGVTFVAVLDPEIATTENGIGVGSREEELHEALGPAARSPRRARDPRIAAFEKAPSAQFVVEDERVVAVIVRDDAPGWAPPARGDVGDADDREAEGGGEEAAADGDRALGAAGEGGSEGEGEGDTEGRCGRRVAWETADPRELARAADLSDDAETRARIEPMCTGADREKLLVTAGDAVALLGGEPDAPSLRGRIEIEGLVYASPIDVRGDGTDEIALVSARRGVQALIIEIAIAVVQGDEIALVDRYEPYRLRSRWTTWVGAQLGDTDLFVDMVANEGTLEIGGLFLHRRDGETRHIAPVDTRTWAPEGLEARRAPAPSGAEQDGRRGDFGDQGGHRDAGAIAPAADAGPPDAPPAAGPGDDDERQGEGGPRPERAPGGVKPEGARDAPPRAGESADDGAEEGGETPAGG